MKTQQSSNQPTGRDDLRLDASFCSLLTSITIQHWPTHAGRDLNILCTQYWLLSTVNAQQCTSPMPRVRGIINIALPLTSLNPGRLLRLRKTSRAPVSSAGPC